MLRLGFVAGSLFCFSLRCVAMTKQSATSYAKFLFERHWPEGWKAKFKGFLELKLDDPEEIVRWAEWITGPPDEVPPSDLDLAALLLPAS